MGKNTKSKMARAKISRKLAEYMVGRRQIEISLRNTALMLAKAGDHDRANVFRKMIESDAIDFVLNDIAGILELRFTLAEMKKLISFYRTSVGQKLCTDFQFIYADITNVTHKRFMDELEKEMRLKDGDFGENELT